MDAAVGFDFALAVSYNKLWVPLVLAVIIILLFVSGIRYCFDTHRKDQQEFAELDRMNAEAWREYHQSQQQQQQYPPPQQYGNFGAYKQPDVEMRPIGSGDGQVNIPRSY